MSEQVERVQASEIKVGDVVWELGDGDCEFGEVVEIVLPDRPGDVVLHGKSGFDIFHAREFVLRRVSSPSPDEAVALLKRLEEWDMLSLDPEGKPLATADAAHWRKEIRRVLDARPSPDEREAMCEARDALFPWPRNRESIDVVDVARHDAFEHGWKARSAFVAASPSTEGNQGITPEWRRNLTTPGTEHVVAEADPLPSFDWLPPGQRARVHEALRTAATPSGESFETLGRFCSEHTCTVQRLAPSPREDDEARAWDELGTASEDISTVVDWVFARCPAIKPRDVLDATIRLRDALENGSVSSERSET